MNRSSSKSLPLWSWVVLVALACYVANDHLLSSSLGNAQESQSPESKGDVKERGLSGITIQTDATSAIQGRTFSDGTHVVSTDKTGFRLEIVVKGGKIMEYIIKDPQGKAYPTNLVVAADKTCWECGKDIAGNTHCWKVACPVRAPGVMEQQVR